MLDRQFIRIFDMNGEIQRLITGTITVGFKWSTTPPSAFQTLFEEATENMRLEISPIVGTVKFHFKGVDYFTGSTFTFCK